jgi:hypothetical protein
MAGYDLEKMQKKLSLKLRQRQPLINKKTKSYAQQQNRS